MLRRRRPLRAPGLMLLLGGVLGELGLLPAQQLDLGALHIGKEPESISVVDGDFRVIETENGTRHVEVSPHPLTESGALFGKTLKGDAGVAASFMASLRGRSCPRFGIGLHGISGHRIRVVPSADRIELLFQEELIATAPFDWQSGVECRLELHARRIETAGKGADSSWLLEAFAWSSPNPRPGQPQLSIAIDQDIPARGKASIWATPYSGLPIRVSAIESTSGAVADNAGQEISPEK